MFRSSTRLYKYIAGVSYLPSMGTLFVVVHLYLEAIWSCGSTEKVKICLFNNIIINHYFETLSSKNEKYQYGEFKIT